MRAPLWVIELAEAFWEAAGEREPFPRRLRGPLAWAVPLTVVELPGLRLGDALDWLNRQQIVARAVDDPCRPLRGFLFADRGAGVVFVDRDDDPAEQVFSLAHELAHFLRDYWGPRRAAERRLGPQVLEVFDGLRPARPEERLHALLRRVPLGCHLHLLARDADPAVSQVEREADRLAAELLAPADVVLADGVADFDTLVDRLTREFGLPPRPAAQYAAWLLPGPVPASPVVDRLRRAFSVAGPSPGGNHLGRQ